MSKFKTEDIISTELDGEVITAKRIITGKRIKYQTIYYKDIEEPDSTMYPKDRQHLMDGKARIILSQIIKRYYEKG